MGTKRVGCALLVFIFLSIALLAGRRLLKIRLSDRDIAYVSINNHGTFAEIFLLNADGTGEQRLTLNDGPRYMVALPAGATITSWLVDNRLVGQPDDTPQWSPDGQHLAYLQTTSNHAPPALRILHNDRTPFASDEFSDFRSFYGWSWDSQYLAAKTTEGNLAILDANQGGAGLTVQPPMRVENPVWSPDSYLIAAFESTSRRRRYTTIVIVDPFNGSQRTLYHHSENAFLGSCCLIWSPDGTKIAYIRFSDNGNQIIVRHANSGTLALSHEINLAGCLDWSPDGNYLSYVMDSSYGNGRHWDLFTFDVFTREQTQLTSNGALLARAICPDWSPDSAWVLYSDRPAGNFDLFKVTPDGRTNIQLTDSPFNELFAVWRPAP